MQSVIEFVMGTAIVAMVGWIFNTNTKIAVQDKALVDQKELTNVKLESIDQRLARIERALNGYLRH